MRTSVRCAARVVTVLLSVALSSALLGSCWLFGRPMEPGDRFPGGEWYAEHDFGLGDRTVRGSFEGGLIEWEERYANEFHISLRRIYDDGTEVDLLADARDEYDFVRIICHEDDGSFLLSGLPSWEQTEDSYVVGEIVNYGGSEDGQPEAYYVEQYFRPAEIAQQATFDIGTYQLKPIDTSYSLTLDLRYMYRGSGSDYVEKTYDELTALGFQLTGDESTWAAANGHGSGNYARVILNVTDAHVRAGEIVFRDALAGGTYEVGANILRDGEYAGFGYGDPTPPTVRIGPDNPSPVYVGRIYID